MSQSLISEDEEPSFDSNIEEGGQLEVIETGRFTTKASSCPEPAVGDAGGPSRAPVPRVHITASPLEVPPIPPKLRRSSRIASQTTNSVILESIRPALATRRKRKLKPAARPATRSIGTQSDSPPPRLRKMMQRSGGAVVTRRRQVGKGKTGPTRALNQQGVMIREEEAPPPPATDDEEEATEDTQSS